MAKTMRMCKFAILLCFALSFNSNCVSGSESADEDPQVSVKLLKHLNEEQGTKYQFNVAKTIETQLKDGVTYFLADVSPVCKDVDDALCAPADMVCQGAVKGEEVSKVRCFLKESHPLMPQYEQGFLVKRSNSFISGILEHGLQKLERDSGRKRRVIEILSVKKRETSATEVFITAKVAAGSEDNGDVLELEMCELAATLGTPGSMQILDTETKCFAFMDDSSSGKGKGMITTDQLKSLVYWALERINVGTDTVFNYTITKITQAEETITPGSGGMTTNMQLVMAVSGCPKKDFLEEVQWKCVAVEHPISCTLSTWERPWRGDTLLSRPRCKKMPVIPNIDKEPVTDVVQSRPSYCTGCLDEVNKDNDKVIELANSAIEQLNNGQLSATPHKLFKVLTAHRQVINGVRYVLNVELVPCIQDSSPCSVAEDAESSLVCRIEMIEGAVDRVRRLSSSLCKPLKEEESTETESTLASGETQTESIISPSPTVQEVEVYSDEDHSTTTGELTTVGQKEEEETVPLNQPHSFQKRTRRASNGLLGGPEPVDLEKEGDKIRKLAEMAMKNIDDIDDEASRRKLVDVVEAKKQVVNGILYHLTIRVAVMPPCDNGETDCVDGELPTLLCKVQVHQAAVADANDGQSTRVMRSECEPEGAFEIQEAANPGLAPETSDPNQAAQPPRTRTRRGALTGAPADADVNDPYIQEIAKYSVAELDKGTNALYQRSIVRLIGAKKQVVAGYLIHLTYELGYSDCRKGSDANLDECKVKDNTDREICEVKVWDKPWLKERSIMNFTCTVSTKRHRRSVLKIGGGSHDIHMGLFLKFTERHGKRYDSEEEFRRRFHIFRANMKKIQHLRDTEQGTAEYGPTRFADLTSTEFKSKYLGLNQKLEKKGKLEMQKAEIPNIQLADEFDWRSYNVVTPVKNQGQCGSCWAFSVTGNVEGQWAIHKGKLLSLSEQELVDCDNLDSGCNGGLPSNAYESIMNIGGLETETDYPYDGKDEKCHFDKGEASVKVTGALNITTDEDSMAKWLTKNGPISIGINANAMQFYYGGVSHPLKFLCDPKNLDHGVLIVGYGVHNYPLFNKTLPYWSIKNSWGPTWGEQGYYRVYRGDGTCGVNLMATSALVV